jgi:glycosyltransferase involved in cell wall biosynthesis
MKISFTGVSRRQEFWDQNTGYGKVFKQLFDNLSMTEYQPAISSKSAPIAICSENPGWLYREGLQYTIGHTTHESTKIVEQWAENLAVVDEIWTPSNWIANVLRNYTDKNILVVPNCTTSSFTSVRRTKDNPFYFVHIGEPTVRKGGDLALQAFVELFGDNPEVFMVFKSSGNTPNLIGANSYSNIIVISDDYTEEQMNNLLSKMHCLVYPTMGEGGGIIPLEAMSTGLPTIATTGWSDYSDYILLPVESKLTNVPQSMSSSTWLRGQIFSPDKESIKQQMLEVYNNYDKYEELYYQQSQDISTNYSWGRVVDSIVVPRLKEIESLYVK